MATETNAGLQGLTEEALISRRKELTVRAGLLSVEIQDLDTQIKDLTQQRAAASGEYQSNRAQSAAISGKLDEISRARNRASIIQFENTRLIEASSVLVVTSNPFARALGTVLNRISQDEQVMKALPDLIEGSGMETYATGHNGDRLSVVTQTDSCRLVLQRGAYAIGYHPKPNTTEEFAATTIFDEMAGRSENKGLSINRHTVAVFVDGLDSSVFVRPFGFTRGSVGEIPKPITLAQSNSLTQILTTMTTILTEGSVVLPKALRSNP